jgi:hypothetical protein
MVMNMHTRDGNDPHDVFIYLFEPGEHLAPKDKHSPPSLILKGQVEATTVGENGMFIRPGQITVTDLLAPGKEALAIDPFAYDFLYFSEEQRHVRSRSNETLQGWMTMLQRDAADKPGAAAADLVPFIILVDHGNRASLYHFAEIGYAGGLYLRFADHENGERPLRYVDLDAALGDTRARLLRRHELFNDNSGFSRWQAEFELERKLTFAGIPDTWRLTQELYQRILSGSFPGFVPELGMEFQVYDYESHVFEVLGPPSEAGYISFIPQSDGKMTIKRKWFVENAELRKETIIGNQAIAFEDIERHVKTMTSGGTRRLSAFRRKRFDVHLESLKTGHIFGIYFDICRIVGDEQSVMSQCEIEYCRSRTLFDLSDVYEEFELIAAHAEAFLVEHGVSFERNLYSKLDFVRGHFLTRAA